MDESASYEYLQQTEAEGGQGQAGNQWGPLYDVLRSDSFGKDELADIVMSFAYQNATFKEYLLFRLTNRSSIDEFVPENRHAGPSRTSEKFTSGSSIDDTAYPGTSSSQDSDVYNNISKPRQLNRTSTNISWLSTFSGDKNKSSLSSASSTQGSLGYDIDMASFGQKEINGLTSSYSLSPDGMDTQNLSFNEVFQSSLDSIGDSSLWEDSQHFDSLSSLAKDFTYAAVHYGKIIISEKTVSNDKKTITPCTDEIGGIAGGEKFMKSGILFKFASAQTIYKDYDDAAKASGHELKGAIGLFNSQDSLEAKLNFPIMTIIDYLGYRLVAMSIVPIDSVSKNTLLYGSPNAGKTVIADDKIHKAMKHVATQLNLKGHIAGASPENSKMLYTPCDIEVHQGSDCRYYCLDFARLFPPEPPNPTLYPTGHLVRLLRPELVRRSSVPLSSDAFSKFSICDSDRAIHEEEVRKAYELLLSTIIPSFAGKLLITWVDNIQNISLDHIIMSMHEEGINVRHIGRIRSFLSIFASNINKLEEAIESIEEEVVLEIIIRTMHIKLAEVYGSLKSSRDQEFEAVIESSMAEQKTAVTKVMNLAYGNSSESERFRNSVLKAFLDDVGSTLSSSSIASSRRYLTSERYQLFRYCSRSTKFRLSPLCDLKMYREGENFFDCNSPFEIKDFVDISSLVDQFDLNCKPDYSKSKQPPETALRKLMTHHFVLICSDKIRFEEESTTNIRAMILSHTDTLQVLKTLEWMKSQFNQLQSTLIIVISELRELLLIEAASRCVKSWLRKSWREQVKELARPASEPYRLIARKTLNLAFGCSSASEKCRSEQLIQDMKAKFEECLSEDDENFAMNNSQKYFPFSDSTSIYIAFKRVVKFCGIVLSEDFKESMSPDLFRRQEKILEDTDIAGISEIVKQMPLVEYAQGSSLFIRAIQKFGKERKQLGRKAERNFERAIAVNSLDYRTLCNLGYLAIIIDEDQPKAIKMYCKALKIRPTHVRSLFYLGILYSRSKLRSELLLAKKYFHEAVQVSPNNGNVLKDYAILLWTKFGEVTEAAERFEQAIDVSSKGSAKTFLWYANFLFNGIPGSYDKHTAGWFYIRAYERDNWNLRGCEHLLNYLRTKKGTSYCDFYFKVAKDAMSILKMLDVSGSKAYRVSRNEKDLVFQRQNMCKSLAKVARHAWTMKKFELANGIFDCIMNQNTDFSFEAKLMYVSHLTKTEQNYQKAEEIYMSLMAEGKHLSKKNLSNFYPGYIAFHCASNIVVLVNVLEYALTSKDGQADTLVYSLVSITVKILAIIRRELSPSSKVPANEKQESSVIDDDEEEENPSEKLSKRKLEAFKKGCQLVKQVSEEMIAASLKVGLAKQAIKEIEKYQEKLEEMQADIM